MLARELNFDGIIAIAMFVTPVWIKSISLINCGKLDAFIGLGEINENNISLNKIIINFTLIGIIKNKLED